MAALPDAESSGIVSSVLKTVQVGGVVVKGWVEPPEAGSTPEGAPWVGWCGCTMFSESEPPHPLISDAPSGRNTFQKIGISSLSRT